MIQPIMTRFHKAIVRIPPRSLPNALTTVELGLPKHHLAVKQHEEYCAALVRCGLEVIRLEALEDFPDSTFVEDTAVITNDVAILTRPGAASRLGEVNNIAQTLTQWLPSMERIDEPGTLDGGDVCEAGNHYFIGISERTNEAGAEQLRNFLARLGYTSRFIDIRGLSGLLHLKSGLASLSNNRLVVTEPLSRFKEFASYELIHVAAGEDYAANCVRLNDHVLLAKGYPQLKATLEALDYKTIELEMSEFQKIDGGLSCLSLRF